MILKIVADVSNELPSTDFNRLVGIEAHVAKIKSMISLESDEVKIVGIWGPAGIGKTTIAKALYNEVSIIFQLKFYKENAEGRKQIINTHDETSLQNHLQNELFSGVLDHRNMKIPELGEAEDRLKHQRVLLILDDVPANELKALRDLIHGLRFGSKVIVISEDIRTLRGYGVDHIYRVAFPSPEQALQMFSYSAFGQNSPPRGYLDHANEVLKLITPYPLGLRVLGSLLRGKSSWTMTLPRLRTYLIHKDNVEEVLKVSYDDLSDKDKMLLYRFKNYVRLGESLNKVILFLAESYWDVEKGIETLVDRGLISTSADGGIMMHYLVKDIVRKDVLARGHNMVNTN